MYRRCWVEKISMVCSEAFNVVAQICAVFVGNDMSGFCGAVIHLALLRLGEYLYGHCNGLGQVWWRIKALGKGFTVMTNFM